MRHFKILDFSYGSFVVTCAADGSVPLNAQVVAMRDTNDRDGAGIRALVDQANVAGELAEALSGLLDWTARAKVWDRLHRPYEATEVSPCELRAVVDLGLAADAHRAWVEHQQREWNRGARMADDSSCSICGKRGGHGGRECGS